MKIVKCLMKVHRHKHQAKQKKKNQNKRIFRKNLRNLKLRFYNHLILVGKTESKYQQRKGSQVIQTNGSMKTDSISQDHLPILTKQMIMITTSTAIHLIIFMRRCLKINQELSHIKVLLKEIKLILKIRQSLISDVVQEFFQFLQSVQELNMFMQLITPKLPFLQEKQ